MKEKIKNDKKKTNPTIPVIGALLGIIGLATYIIMKVSEQQAYEEKWKDYDDCGWM